MQMERRFGVPHQCVSLEMASSAGEIGRQQSFGSGGEKVFFELSFNVGPDFDSDRSFQRDQPAKGDPFTVKGSA